MSGSYLPAVQLLDCGQIGLLRPCNDHFLRKPRHRVGLVFGMGARKHTVRGQDPRGFRTD